MTKISISRLMALVTLVAGICEPLSAESWSARKTDIRLQGRGEVVVTEEMIRLSDIALIESASVADDNSIMELRKIPVASSPKAGETTTLEGARILEKLRDAGVRLDSLLYTFPKEVRVTRAYREVSQDELERALKSFLLTQDRQIEVKQLLSERPIKVPTDALNVEVVALHATQPGHFGVDYRLRANSGDVRFQMKALADEWRMVPTAVRPLKRGDVVSAADIRLTKMNAGALNSGALEQIGDVVDMALLRDVGQGEVFTSKAVKLPAVVESGSKVTMVFRRGRLEATASGVALEDGALDQEINVRNESSKKVVRARVSERGIVLVGARG
jgi:flagella basal body P-ring formation protein FlgA